MSFLLKETSDDDEAEKKIQDKFLMKQCKKILNIDFFILSKSSWRTGKNREI